MRRRGGERTGVPELTGGGGSPSAPGPEPRCCVMVMPAIHPWAGKCGLSTSVHHVLCQALGHRREQGKEVLPKEGGSQEGLARGDLGEEHN